jgi:A/G-specific adenine glycosylase
MSRAPLVQIWAVSSPEVSRTASDLTTVLQQTRVSTVIPYFNNWISKWPTVQDLADADHDDVLAAWKGLGYYSRATRLHEGAKAMIAKSTGSSCPLPTKAIDLQEFPGIGRYTAGAVSSIAFGEPEPVLDGNVIRVLSRQLGLYMDGKDKKASDVLWEEADRLIKHVSGLSDPGLSATPGQWNQALMELGSTVCTPKPQCADCPIQATCRVYREGQALSAKRQSPTAIADIEDACTLCDLLDTEDLVAISEEADEGETPQLAKKRKVNTKQKNTLSQYFAIGKANPKLSAGDEAEDDSGLFDSSKKRKAPISDFGPTPITKSITTYCSLFPKKVAKKQAKEEECVVCLIEMCPPSGKSKWLIEQRPAKGLLASLWYVTRGLWHTFLFLFGVQRVAIGCTFGLFVHLSFALANFHFQAIPAIHVIGANSYTCGSQSLGKEVHIKPQCWRE